MWNIIYFIFNVLTKLPPFTYLIFNIQIFGDFIFEINPYNNHLLRNEFFQSGEFRRYSAVSRSSTLTITH